ncbi:putative tape measure protein [Pseudomonas phage vB_PaeM_VL12]|nr:putative tape measure protein [Pseudomonas phage vB_PaeM_VL12]
MATEEITKLVGTIQWRADNRPLLTFKKNLEQVRDRLNEVAGLANKKVTMRVDLDGRSLAAKIKMATNAQIRLKNVDIAQDTLGTMVKKLSERLANTPVTLSNVRFNIKDIAQQKRFLRTFMQGLALEIPVSIRARKAEQALLAWKRQTEQRFTLHLNADISQSKFYRNARRTIDAVIQRLGTITLRTPNIRLSVDRAHLRQEIADVLAQIRREARIRIDLQGHVNQVRGRNAHAVGGMAGAGAGAAVAHWGRGFIPGLGGAFAISQMNQMGQQMIAQQNAMAAVGGSQEAGQATMAQFKQMANEIGFDWRAVAPSYTKMLASGQGAGMDKDVVDSIFRSMTEYGTVMGLDTESMKGSLRAVEQMMNKEQVMSEELKLQLGERFPAAMSLMAQAVSAKEGREISTKELGDMMAKGLVRTDVLPEFARIIAEKAREGGALSRAQNSTAAQQQRFNNAWSDAVGLIYNNGMGQGMANLFKEMARTLNDNEEAVKGLGAAMEWLLSPFEAAAILIRQMLQQLPDLASKLGLTSGQLMALAGAIGLALFPLGQIALAIGGLFLVVEDFVGFLQGKDSVIGDFFNQLTPEQQAVWLKIGGAVVQTAEAVGRLAEAMGELLGGFAEGGMFSTALDFFTSKILAVLTVITKLVQAAEALKNKDFGKAAKLAGDAGAVALSNSPVTMLLRDDLRQDLEARARRAQNDMGRNIDEDVVRRVPEYLKAENGVGGMPSVGQITLNIPIQIESAPQIQDEKEFSEMLQTRIMDSFHDTLRQAMVDASENKK